MGCGTGVLAILADEKEALQAVDAIDIDNWCYLNSLRKMFPEMTVDQIHVFRRGCVLT